MKSVSTSSLLLPILRLQPQGLDFVAITMKYDNDLTRYFEDWTRRFATESDMTGASSVYSPKIMALMACPDPACAFRASLLPL